MDRVTALLGDDWRPADSAQGLHLAARPDQLRAVLGGPGQVTVPPLRHGRAVPAGSSRGRTGRAAWSPQ
ncbi:hypothetical protein ACF1BB_00755 [Streptomyces griseoluteus]|uniref:hypothetical protein n=1 Tax=Streptomyces griseoluteus TaxID=29306 RepID=UPI0036FC9027